MSELMLLCRWRVSAWRSLSVILGCAVCLSACPAQEPAQVCQISADCGGGGQVCVAGVCIVPSDPDVGMLPDVEDDPTDPCALAPSPRRGQLVLNEILAAVPADEDLGDVNGDGVRDSAQDEFFEFVNITDGLMRVKGLKVFKDGEPEPTLVVESGCLEPKQSLVVFGGLDERGTLPSYPDTVVEISLSTFGLRNSGMELRVETEEGLALFEGVYPGATGTSVTLDPQLGSAFGNYVLHNTLVEAPFSPGTCAEGDALSTGCPQPPPECPGASFAEAGELLVNEVLSAVPSGDVEGDANGDGVRSSSADEFIEIVNTSPRSVVIEGLRIFKANDEKAALKTECLRPGQVLVVFAGLEAGADPPRLGQALVEISEATWGLTNGGSVLRLVAPDDTEVVRLDLPSATGESLTREVELSGQSPFVGHTEINPGALFSPGTCADGSPISAGCPPPEPECPDAEAPTADTLMINEVLAAVPTGDEGDANGDGVRSSSADEFIEIVNTGVAPILIEGVRIFKAGDEKATLQTECLQPNQALVVFAGLENGASPPDLGEVLVEISSSTWGLTNGGTTLRLVGADDVEIISLELPSSSGESLTRQTDLDPNSPLVGHTDLNPEALFSPGTCAGGGALSSGC